MHIFSVSSIHISIFEQLHTMDNIHGIYCSDRSQADRLSVFCTMPVTPWKCKKWIEQDQRFLNEGFSKQKNLKLSEISKTSLYFGLKKNTKC